MYLTEQATQDSLPERDRPAEIEVTKAMIDAGVAAFAGYEEGWELLGDRLSAVFRAMTGAMKRPAESTTPQA
jgi:hypothetical protein